MSEPTLPTVRESLLLPDRSVVKLALAFARIASSDLRVSKLVYDNKFYPQAVFSLQQSVEKAIKAVGLLMGLVEPTRKDLSSSVGHASIMAVVVRLPERVVKIRKNIRMLRSNPNVARALKAWNKLGIPIQLPELSKMEAELISDETAKEQVKIAQLLRSRGLWKLTLDLNPIDPRTTIATKLLDDAEAEWKIVDMLQKLAKKVIDARDPDSYTMSYLLNVNNKAFREVGCLAVFTMGHEMETRYPPVEKGDYWDPSKYTADSGLVKFYPRLYRHTERLCGGAESGALAAMRI